MKKRKKKQPCFNTKLISTKTKVENKVVNNNNNSKDDTSQALYIGIEGEFKNGIL